MSQLGFPREFPSQGVFPPVWGDPAMTTQPFSAHHKPVPQGPPLPQSIQGDHPEPLLNLSWTNVKQVPLLQERMPSVEAGSRHTLLNFGGKQTRSE